MLRLKSLETIILAPVVTLLILAGIGIYFVISKSVDDFANRSIQENLSSLSRAAYEEADDEIDRCDIKGLDCFSGPQKTIHQSAVFVRFEDLARENEFGIVVCDMAETEVSFQSGVADTSINLKQLCSAQDAIIRGRDGATFYARSIEFNPWDWRVVLLKDSAAFANLKEQVRNFYIGTGAVVLLIAGSLIMYLRRVIAHPINHMVGRLREKKAPEYEGIRELEYLSNSIGDMMGEVFRHRHHLEELVEARTGELEEARSRLTDAIESISEGFSLYDADDRLVQCNSRYRQIMLPPDTEDFMVLGTPFEKIARTAAERGVIDDAEGRVDEWLAERMAKHRDASEPFEVHRRGDRWVLISERRTSDGGTVAVHTDITRVKRAEEALLESKQRTEEASKLVAEKNQMLESLSNQLSKYLSPQVYASIFSGEQSVEIASKRKKLTIFFSDIADFTGTTESLESEDLTNLLNHYLTEMSKIALDHGATIDKYVGDAIIAFFGDPETRGVKEDARACVSMAIAMQRRMRELRSEWLDMGLERPFEVRIGINTGFCTVGNFGSEDRMDYTIIGNEVNLAARLETHADVGGILLAHETHSLVKGAVMAEEGDTLTVKGFAKPVRTYSVVGLYDDLAEQGRIIRKEQDGVRVLVDLKKGNKADAIKAIEDILSQLKG